MSKTIRIPHSAIDKPDKVTPATEKAFKEVGLNCRVNEVTSLSDDMDKGVRELVVNNTQYFIPSNSKQYRDNFDQIKWSSRPSPHSAEG